MRIVAGVNKGRAISAPEGDGTRPTTDRVREALFSSLYSMLQGFEGLQVLDAFAGSGALGLEALSRGAARAVFYERDEKALRTLRKNVEACACKPGEADVRRRDVLQSPPVQERNPFDLVFLDPPYATDAREIMRFIDALRGAGSISSDTLIVYEHALSARDAVEEAARKHDMHVSASKKYGKTAITVLKVG